MPEEPATSRYTRQEILPGIGRDGQDRIGGAHAMIVGCGALGCTSADLLVRAGVGRVTIVDRDTIEISNLHRQTLFTHADAHARLPKASTAAERLRDVNPDIRIQGLIADLNPGNAESLIDDNPFGRPDVFVDGTDNFETRYLINDLSVMLGIPYVYGGAVGTSGMLAVFVPGSTPCLRCVFDEAPTPGTQPTCTTAGVLAPVSSAIASLQTAETLKILVGAHNRVSTDLLCIEGWENSTKRVSLLNARNQECACCGHRTFAYLDAMRGSTVSLCGRNTVQVSPASSARVNLSELRARLCEHGSFEGSDSVLRGTLTKEDGIAMTVFGDGRALIEGTDDPGVARAVYDRYIGT